MSRRIAVLLLAGALALAGGAAQAQLKKWVDAEGRVHYSDKPPPSGVKEEEVKIRNAPAPAAAQPAPSYQDKELEFRKRRIEAQEAAKKAQEEAARKRDEAENCQQAQNRLRSIEETGRVYTYDAKGDRVYMDDAARERELAAAREAIRTWCK